MANGKLLHRLFIGVTIPEVVTPPDDTDNYWLFEDGQIEQIENNDYIIQEN